MLLLEHAHLARPQFQGSVATVGNFDGVHLGHRSLLRQVARRARELGVSSVVYTFHPHPLKVLNPSLCPPLLTSFEDRAALVAAEGIDALVWARFDRDYATQEPEAFARDTLAASLQARELWVGPDFVFGRGRRGSIAMLQEAGVALGFRVRVIEPLAAQGEAVSSTRIRQAVNEGDFETAERLLGRPYSLHGPVVHGEGRGRGLGFPTANVLPREECMPPPGVYAGWVLVEGVPRPAAVNVGPNPTFEGCENSVEAYLLDFSGDLYGREVELRFVSPLRGEVAFRSAEDLSRQIRRDVESVRRILGLEGLSEGRRP
jgi:riboflavin kinase/FMN adenylyltransferase